MTVDYSIVSTDFYAKIKKTWSRGDKRQKRLSDVKNKIVVPGGGRLGGVDVFILPKAHII